MLIAVRTCDGQKRIYRYDSNISIDELIKIVKQEVPIAKTVLIECPPPKQQANR